MPCAARITPSFSPFPESPNPPNGAASVLYPGGPLKLN